MGVCSPSRMVHDNLPPFMAWLCLVVLYLSIPAKIEGGAFIALLTLILFFFLCNNLLFMFITFEISLVPILFLIIGWGYQFERLSSASYILMYTFIFSIPHLFLLFIYFSRVGSGFIFYKGGLLLRSTAVFVMFMAFLVKLPMFIVHGWLPKAHVEAPTIGSVILAALLLKLGSFGLLRLFFLVRGRFALWICLVGAIISTLLCSIQSDGKSMIAFSSVCHINMLVVGVVIGYLFTSWAAVVIIISHGVTRAGLFFIFGGLFTSKISRKIYFLQKGGAVLVGCRMILLLFSNFGVPPFLRRVAEILLIGGTFTAIKLSAAILVGYVVVCGYFRLFLLGAILFGKKQSRGRGLTDQAILALLLGGVGRGRLIWATFL